MATAMAAMDMLRTMMPLVHESDLEAALGDLRGLCHKWNARREYRLELAAAEGHGISTWQWGGGDAQVWVGVDPRGVSAALSLWLYNFVQYCTTL